MSDAAAEKTDKAPAAGGNKKLLLVVLAVNVLLAGGLGYVVLGRSQAPDKPKHAAAKGEGGDEEDGAKDKDKEDEKEPEAEEEESKDAKHPAGKFGPLVEVGSFVANLAASGPTPARYAKVTVAVEALNEDAKTRVEAALIPLRSEALLLMSNAKPEDVIGQEKIMAMSAELLKRLNKLLGKKSIKHVYFSELVVQ
jgi:flagellar basal body-associated protein FliL